MNKPPPPTVDFTSLKWTKARAGSAQGACVEVAAAPGGWVAPRDSRHPDRDPLLYMPK